VTRIGKLASLGCIVLVMTFAAASTQASLLLYYDFESDAGATIANQGSLGTNGALVGADALTAGPGGGFSSTTARTFDGTTTHVDTLIGAIPMGVHQSANYTMAAWLRPLSNAGDHMVFGQPSGARLHNGTRNDQYYQGHWGNDLGGGSVNGIPLGNWRHVTWLYQDGSQQIFLNGSSVVGPAARGPLNNTGNIWIGNSEAWRFQGDLDDVVIYSEALAPNQIAWLAAGGDPTDLPEPPPQPLDWDFRKLNLQGWTVLNGDAHFRTGDGGGMTPANSTGGFAHDGGHETFLVESPLFRLTGETVDGTNALIVQFAGGAGDQNGAGVIFNTPAAVVAYNGGNSNSNGQKGLAFYNVATGVYDATIFEPTNGGTDTRLFTMADLTALGVDPSQWYRLHYYENDQGGWGWGQLNFVQAAAVLPEPATFALVGFGLAGLRAYRRRRRA